MNRKFFNDEIKTGGGVDNNTGTGNGNPDESKAQGGINGGDSGSTVPSKEFLDKVNKASEKSSENAKDVSAEKAEKAEYADTVGNHRVGASFNPSQRPDVDQAKSLLAAMIDELEKFRSSSATDGEHHRVISEAQTRLEDAAMWVVKALTKSARK